MFHKVQSVAAQKDFILLVTFAEGISKKYDVTPLFERIPVFCELRDTPNLFEQVVVDVGGYGISWNDDIDLACDELWANGVVVQTPFDNLIALSDATYLWGLNESTLRKAVSYGKLKPGVDVLKFGKQWIISKQAMIREYGLPRQ